MRKYDPSFLRARHEAILILIAWAVFLIWTVGYSALAGYTDSSLLLGMPRWVVLGILLPWVAATLFSVWFSLYYMTDDSPDGTHS